MSYVRTVPGHEVMSYGCYSDEVAAAGVTAGFWLLRCECGWTKVQQITKVGLSIAQHLRHAKARP